jgi:hypothetical protein
MSARSFEFRLRSRHSAPDRSRSDLEVAWLHPSGRWEAQQPDLTTPGFRLYLLSLLLCQHHYLVANALERHLPLQQVEGLFSVTTTADWIIEAVEGSFTIRLDPARGADEQADADGAAIEYIRERMRLCPVSRNLREGVAKRISLDVST